MIYTETRLMNRSREESGTVQRHLQQLSIKIDDSYAHQTTACNKYLKL